MALKKQDPTSALVAVVKALEPLEDKDREWVQQSAASRWNLGSVSAITSPIPAIRTGGGPVVTASADVQSALAKNDVRAFIRLKRPNTDVQRVACLGYFLTQVSGQQGFSSKDITKAHVDSGAPSINVTRALDNATRAAKYLSNRGPKEKQLTTLGEDVVLALPDQQLVKEAEAAGKMRGKARAKKKIRKKG
jgi:hypothetical protein